MHGGSRNPKGSCICCVGVTYNYAGVPIFGVRMLIARDFAKCRFARLDHQRQNKCSIHHRRRGRTLLAISSRRVEGIGFEDYQLLGALRGNFSNIQLHERIEKERLTPLLHRKLGKRCPTELEFGRSSEGCLLGQARTAWFRFLHMQ